MRPRKRLVLPLRDERVDARDLDLEQRLDRRLDLRLGRVVRDPEDDLVLLGQGVAFSVITGREDDVVMARIGMLI